MIDTLTKENFWDAAKEKYPRAIRHFLRWIDTYKQRVDWDFLFEIKPGTARVYRFHEIPGAMQLGIIQDYLLETYQSRMFLFSMDKNLPDMIDSIFKIIEEKYIDKNITNG